MARMVCFCRCHDEPDLPSRVMFKTFTSATPVNDPLEAAVACDECRNFHCPALLCALPELGQRSPREKSTKQDLEVVLRAMRENPDLGEGAES